MAHRIAGRDYTFHKDFQQDDTLRRGLNKLAQQTFGGLTFEPWYELGFWHEWYAPYALFNGDNCVCCVMANRFDLSLGGEKRRYVQLGTVMTDPAHRGRGLSRLLLERVLADWQGRCDAVYLYANDSVTDFYPRFGFVERQEFQDSVAISDTGGEARRLDVGNPADRALLLERVERGNPYAAVHMPDSAGIVLFHCIGPQRGNLLYLPDFDLVVVAEQGDGVLTCYDIFGEPGRDLAEVLAAVAQKGTRRAVFGFSLEDRSQCETSPYQEEDCHFFVYPQTGCEIVEKGLILPVLCRT